MQELQANTLATVLIGPFVDKGDGVTPEEGVTLAAADSAEVMKHNGTTFVDIAGAGGNQATLTHKEKGMYTLAIPAAVISDEGRLTVFISDESVCLPVWKDFMVLAQAAWISKYTAKDSGYMDVDIKAVGGTATPHTSGKLHILNGDGAAIVAAGPTKTEMDNAIATIIADTEDLQTILGTPANFMADVSGITAAGPTKTEMDNGHAAIVADTEDLQGNVDTMHDTDLPAVKTVVDAIQTDLGDFSGRTNNKSLLAVLGVPDVAAKDLHTLLVTDRLDHGTYGLSALETLVDQLEGYCDLIDDATNGLAAIKAEVEGLGGAAMVGTNGAALASSWTAALATALANYNSTRAGYLDNLSVGAVALEATLTTMKQVTAGGFDRDTDSLQAIRDRGDTAWITGGGGTAADIADAVWDELLADHQTADTMGEALADATEITLEED